jgi:hypothetical protein
VLHFSTSINHAIAVNVLSICENSRSALAVVTETRTNSRRIIDVFGYIALCGQKQPVLTLEEILLFVATTCAATYYIHFFDDGGRVCELFTVTANCYL